MRLIQSDEQTVTLQMEREQFQVLRAAVSEATFSVENLLPKCRRLLQELADSDPGEVYGELLDEGLGDQCETIEDLQREIKRLQKFLPKAYPVCDLLDQILEQIEEADLTRA